MLSAKRSCLACCLKNKDGDSPQGHGQSPSITFQNKNYPVRDTITLLGSAPQHRIQTRNGYFFKFQVHSDGTNRETLLHRSRNQICESQGGLPNFAETPTL